MIFKGLPFREILLTMSVDFMQIKVIGLERAIDLLEMLRVVNRGAFLK
jgi:hypothetical protein